MGAILQRANLLSLPLPQPPPPGHVPSCQEAGGLGAVAGIIGLFQANEALKEILGIGQSMAGRFLIFDALDLSFTEMKIQRNPQCLLCGENPAIKELIDYTRSCPGARAMRAL